MKKFLLFFLFASIFLVLPKKADAFFLTKNLVSKAVLADGIKLRVCPVDLALDKSKPTADLDSKVTTIFPKLENYPCKGSEQKFIFAQLSVTIPNSKKTANEFLYIFNDDLLRSDSVGYSSEVPAGTDDISWVNNADFVYYRGLNKISFGDVNTKEPLSESELIMQNPHSAKTTYTSDQLTALFNNVPLFDGSQKVNKDTSPLCSNSTNAMCQGNTQMYVSDQNYDAVKSWYLGKLPNKSQACTFTEATTTTGESNTKISQLDYAACTKDTGKNISIFIIQANGTTIIVFNYTNVSNIFLLMYKGTPYRVSRVEGQVKDVVLVDYSSEKRDQNAVATPEKVVTEINNFPRYDNADFVFKEATPACDSNSNLTSCENNYFHWQTLDGFDQVMSWFTDQTKKDGWVCDFSQTSVSGGVAKIGGFSCDKDDSHFWIDLVSDGTVTTIKLTVPKVALHLTTDSGPPPDTASNSATIKALPAYPGSITKGLDINPKCATKPNDLACGVTSQSWETKDSFQKVIAWFKSYKFDPSWKCTWEAAYGPDETANYAREDCKITHGLLVITIDDRKVIDGEDTRIIRASVSIE